MPPNQQTTKRVRKWVPIRCKICGFKIRGLLHEKGSHHVKAARSKILKIVNRVRSKQ